MKKALLIITILIISGCGVLSYILGHEAQKINEYKFYTDNKDLQITSIYIGDRIRSNKNYLNKNTELDKETNNIILKKESRYTPFLTIKRTKIDNIYIQFENKTETGEISVEENSKLTDVISIKNNSKYTYSNSTVSLIINYIKNINIKQILLLILIALVEGIITFICLKYILKFLDNLDKITIPKIILFVLSEFILFLLSYYALMLVFGLLTLVPIFIILIHYIIKNKELIKNNLQVCYVLIATTIGIMMLFTIPPMNVPDENIHFCKIFVAASTDDYYIKGKDHLPVEVEEFVANYKDGTLDARYKLSPRTYFYDMYNTLNYRRLSHDTRLHRKTAGLYVMSYIPALMTILVTKIINMPIYYVFILARLVNLIVLICTIYYVIKNVSYFKKAFFVVGLLPIVLHQAAAVNQDCITNAIFIFVLYKFINLIFGEDKADLNNIAILFLSALCLSCCKFGYFPVSFLALLIPANKFTSKKLYHITRLSFIFIPMLLSLYTAGAGTKLAGHIGNYNYRDHYKVNLIWTDPKLFIIILYNTIIHRLDLDFFRGLIDGYGWSTKWTSSLPLFISQTSLMLLVLCKDKNDKKMNLIQILAFLIIIAMICAIIYGSMLFGWTIVGSTSIDGLQPRYFVPVTLMLIMVLSNIKIFDIKVENKNLYYAISIIIINIVAVYTLLTSFYI